MSDKIIIGSNAPLDTLVAITQKEQAKGLMHKAWPPPIMTFAFDKSSIHKFWMRQTPSPLDLIFCQAGKVIAIYQGEPLSIKHIGPNIPTNLVVEMPQGMAKELNISANDSVSLVCSSSTRIKYYQNILTK